MFKVLRKSWNLLKLFKEDFGETFFASVKEIAEKCFDKATTATFFVDYEAVVKLSDGFNGADLRNVCTEAGRTRSFQLSILMRSC